MSTNSSIPMSPSWRRTLNHQGGRPSRVSLQYRRQNSDSNVLTVSKSGLGNNSGGGFFGNSWLLTPPNLYLGKSSGVALPSTDVSPTSNSPTNPQAKTSPFLAIALLKLEKALPEFCTTLTGSHAGASQACVLLDSNVATAGSPASSRPSSPKIANKNGHMMSSSPLSPKSPLFSWLSSTGSTALDNRISANPYSTGYNANTNASTTPATSALALEGEWEQYIGPLLCWAGAEVLYHDMVWVADDDRNLAARNLIGLYQRIITDLVLVQQFLCDPFLNSITSISSTSYQGAARSLSASMSGIATVCTIRIQFLDWLSSSFFSTAESEDENTLVEVLEPLNVTDLGAARVWKERLHDEYRVWQHVSAARTALESCRFQETILSLSRWKRDLKDVTETRLDRWFRQSHQDIMSLLPIYFDRIDAFSGPIYGFDSLALKTKTYAKDWDETILEFLRKQDKAGGPPTAVALVLDAIATNNRHVERGFQLTLTKELPEDEEPLRVIWPAIYLRSSVHLAAATTQRMSLSGVPHGSGLLRKSGASSSWTKPDSPRASKKVVKWNVMEYASDNRAVASFPHSEWKAMVSLVRNEPTVEREPILAGPHVIRTQSLGLVEQAQAITFRDEDAEDEEKHSRDSLFSVEEAANMFATTTVSESTRDTPTTDHLQSEFHVVSLSEYISMVVIVKGEEESRWHRRRSRLPDSEIRQFLDEMALDLRVANVFSSERIPSAPKKVPYPLLWSRTTHQVWDEDAIQDLLRSIKDSFGLRPIHSSHDTLRASLQSRQSPNILASRRGSPSRRRRRVRQNQSLSLPVSAAALFLGPELAHLIE